MNYAKKFEDRGYIPALWAAGLFASTYQRGALVPVALTVCSAGGLFVAAMEAERIVGGGYCNSKPMRIRCLAFVFTAFVCISIVYRVGPGLIIQAGSGNWVIGGNHHAVTGPGLLAVFAYLAPTEYWLTRIVARALDLRRPSHLARFAGLMLSVLLFKLAGAALPLAAGLRTALLAPAYVQVDFPGVYWIAVAGYVAGGLCVVRQAWEET